MLVLLEPAFYRLFWVLFVDFLVAIDFLKPDQRQQWADGYVQIIIAAGVVASGILYQHHGHKKDVSNSPTPETLTVVTGTLPKQSRIQFVTQLVTRVKGFVLTKKTVLQPEPPAPNA